MNNQVPEKNYGPFLPVSLVALSVCILMGWNLLILVKQHSNALTIIAQQDIQMAQAGQAEAKLKQMMADLVELAKEDTDAETIVKRHGITFNAPAPAPVALPSKKPVKKSAKPTVKETPKAAPEAMSEKPATEEAVETPATPAKVKAKPAAKPPVEEPADK